VGQSTSPWPAAAAAPVAEIIESAASSSVRPQGNQQQKPQDPRCHQPLPGGGTVSNNVQYLQQGMAMMQQTGNPAAAYPTIDGAESFAQFLYF